MAEIAFEDLTPGLIVELGTETVDRDEMVAFARRFDPQPFHVDETAGKESLFGGLAASGWFTASLWMGLLVRTMLVRSTSLGAPGGDHVAWLAPVFAGDVLTGRAEILEARRSRSRPELGLVRLEGTLRRVGSDGVRTAEGEGEGELVFRTRFTGMFGARTTP